MPLQQPEESGRSDNTSPLKGRSFSSAERISLDGFSRNSVEFAAALVTLCLQIHARKLVIMTPQTRAIVQEFDLFEWNTDYPKDVPARSFPYFSGDRRRHGELIEVEEEIQRLQTAEDNGEELDPKYLRPTEAHPNTPWSFHMAILGLQNEAADKMQELRRRATRGISVPEGRIRPTDFGELVIGQLHSKPLETGAQIVRVLLRSEDKYGKGARIRMIEHVADLWDSACEVHATKAQRIQLFNRHVRKLGVALLENGLSFVQEDLELRAKRITAESFVDVYLADARTRAQQHRHELAYEWLQGYDKGQFCPTPYPSWQPRAKKESFEESYKIVARARHHAYHTFNRLRMENRTVGGEMPLFREFAMDVFEDVRFVRGDDIDAPPGRGTVMSGARLDKLFFPLEGESDLLKGYENDPNLWFGSQLRALESCTVIALRGWIGVTAATPDFVTLNDHYYYIIDNDHFSGSYGFAYGIPTSVVSAKLRRAMYNLDQGPRHVMDVGALEVTIPDLLAATREAGKLALTLGHMSPLFGGMCNALPVGSKPVFGWESNHQSVVWRDVYNHVHWSWLVWSFKEDRKGVEKAVRPLSRADHEVRDFALSGQKLFEAVKHRYGAWKNDQTPGEKTAPRLLARAYDIYREHQAKGLSGKSDETIYIGVADRSRPQFEPLPIINCFTLDLQTKTGKVKLPEKGTGMENAELSLWRRHVLPMISFTTKEGVRYEGPYELVIMGENDIKGS